MARSLWDDGTKFTDGTRWSSDVQRIIVNPLSIQNYSQLKTAIASWMARPELNTQIEDFIALAEAQFRRVLRVEDQEVVNDAFVIDSQTEDDPVLFGGIRRLYIPGSPVRDLKYLTPEQFFDTFRTTAPGKPCNFTKMDNKIWFGPTPDQAYTATLIYWERFEPLSTSAPTNALLSRHPDLYLFGSLLAGEEYFHNDRRIAFWKSRRDEVIAEIRAEDLRQRTTGSVLVRTPFTSERSRSGR